MIRERSDADLDTCVALLRDVHELAGYPVNWPADPHAWLTPVNRLGCWVAVVDDRVAGHVVLTEDKQGGAAVERLFVDPQATRAGVGRRLLEHCVSTAAEWGRRLTLEVVDKPDSPAIALYRRAGWQETARTPIDWAGPQATHLLHFQPPT
ncbi:GNAT family N-acetyltransferase [Kribbella sp. NPDC005582]|uniref:GNAT family N-acetyltransferase n=1 Tax=Kribbella sp. NPDC005582 TaxID=3156893 RepID=UPI0033B329CF